MGRKKKIEAWKILSSKVLFTHPRITLHEDTVKLPNGTILTYVKRAPTEKHSVAVIAVNKRGHILVQREYSHPPNLVMWQLPGGGMNVGEDILAAARRELAEESGYGAKNARLLGYYYASNRFSDQKQYVVECTDLYDHKLPEDAEEFIDNQWITVKKINKMIEAGEVVNINMLASLQLWQRNK